MTTLNVLIPLDGSSFSQQILRRVHGLLEPRQHRLILMRVTSPPVGVVGIPPTFIPFDGEFRPHYTSTADLEQRQHPIYATQTWENIKTTLSAELNHEVSTLQRAGFDVSLLVHFGEAEEEIIRATQQQHIDFIVMATHGRKGVERVLLGSVAEEVLRHVNVPVLMLRPEGEEKITTKASPSKVLIPLDETRFSRAVLKHVLKLLRPSDHHLTLLRVAPPPDGKAYTKPIVPVALSVTSDDAKETTAAKKQLEQDRASQYSHVIDDYTAERLRELEDARVFLRDAGFNVECAVRFGHAAEEIGSFATFNNVSLIVMATHSHTGIDRLLLGSVARSVLSNVHLPIMMIKPHLETASETLPNVVKVRSFGGSGA